MYNENSLLHVKQLVFEIHITAKSYRRYFDTLIKLEHLGFRRYLMHRNQRCSVCFEIYYVNINFLP